MSRTSLAATVNVWVASWHELLFVLLSVQVTAVEDDVIVPVAARPFRTVTTYV